jgi:hypothetical protein
MLASAEPVDCAGFSRGRVSREHLHAMLGQPEVSEIERWYDLIVQAEAADLAPSHTPPSTMPVSLIEEENNVPLSDQT